MTTEKMKVLWSKEQLAILGLYCYLSLMIVFLFPQQNPSTQTDSANLARRRDIVHQTATAERETASFPHLHAEPHMTLICLPQLRCSSW